MIKVEWFYWLCAAFFAGVALIRLTDTADRKRFGSAAFWGILAFAFVYGTFVVAKTAPPLVEGIAVLALAALAGLGFPGKGTERTNSDEQRRGLATRFGNQLFLPALLIPLIAVLFGAALVNVKVGGGLLLEKGYATIIGLGVAAIVAFVAGEDFVSPALCEADLMRRILPENEFTAWLATFLPHLAASGDPLFNVPRVLDRTDGKMVHLYGLALSRAWQLRLLAPYLTTDHRARIASGTRQQIEAVEREIVDGDFMSTHWLVSFAVLAVTATSEVDI